MAARSISLKSAAARARRLASDAPALDFESNVVIRPTVRTISNHGDLPNGMCQIRGHNHPITFTAMGSELHPQGFGEEKREPRFARTRFADQHRAFAAKKREQAFADARTMWPAYRNFIFVDKLGIVMPEALAA